MAKIVIEFDTVAKTCAVALDGRAMADVTELNIGRDECGDPADGFKYRLTVRQGSADKANGTRTTMTTYASAGGADPEVVHPVDRPALADELRAAVASLRKS